VTLMDDFNVGSSMPEGLQCGTIQLVNVTPYIDTQQRSVTIVFTITYDIDTSVTYKVLVVRYSVKNPANAQSDRVASYSDKNLAIS